MDSIQELQTKLERARAILRRHRLDALQIHTNANMAWLTGGLRTYIDTASERGVIAASIGPTHATFVTNNIEAERLQREEGFSALAGHCDMVVEPWYEPSVAMDKLSQGLRVGSDRPGPGQLDVGPELVAARAPLLPPEVERYRALGRDASLALWTAARQLEPGMSEHQAAARVAEATVAVGAWPTVILVASDARLGWVRHPLPTAKPMDKTCMLVLCARRHGLIANLTRLVCFGRPPAELVQRLEAVARIDAEAMAATRPGVTLGDVFARIQATYASVGFADAWQQHHQGGPCSYGGRDTVATPASTEVVHAAQAFAWNPSVPGAKSEDTMLVDATGQPEILTAAEVWPTQPVAAQGLTIARPTVMER